MKALNWKLACHGWHLEKLIELTLSRRPKIITASGFGVFLTWNVNFIPHQPFYSFIVLLSQSYHDLLEILFNLQFSHGTNALSYFIASPSVLPLWWVKCDYVYIKKRSLSNRFCCLLCQWQIFICMVVICRKKKNGLISWKKRKWSRRG